MRIYALLRGFRRDKYVVIGLRMLELAYEQVNGVVGLVEYDEGGLAESARACEETQRRAY